MPIRARVRVSRSSSAYAWIAWACLTRCTPAAHACDDARVVFGDAGQPPGPDGFTPYLAGEYIRVFVPAATDAGAGSARYLNDHTLVRGDDGTWHLFGITNTGEGMPFEEHSLLHAVAPALAGPWTSLDDALAADAAQGEGCCLWAPHVVRLPGALPRYLMVYATDGGGLRRATSTDLVAWTRNSADVQPATRPPGGRDPYLLHDGERWLLYSVGVDPATDEGQIVVATTRSAPEVATDWTTPVAVTTDPVPNYPWGNLESPTVVPFAGAYYLFTTRTANDGADYVRTIVLRGSDPLDFGWAPITDLRAHAAEVVHADGAFTLSSAGWPEDIGEPNRGLLLAPLGWAPLPVE